MFQSYEQIFSKRADAYQKAMELFPAARDREFQLVVEAADISACGFDICTDELVRFPWSFDNRHDMGVYCKLLFGMDLAEPETVIEAIEDLLGLMPGPGKVNMAWSLRFITATNH